MYIFFLWGVSYGLIRQIICTDICLSFHDLRFDKHYLLIIKYSQDEQDGLTYTDDQDNKIVQDDYDNQIDKDYHEHQDDKDDKDYQDNPDYHGN